MGSLSGVPGLGIRVRVVPEMAPSMLLLRGRMFRSFRVSASSSSPPSSTESIRVRFAPSPTGNLHVGGARTALFNYLFARSKGGKFVLRIEDTDLERSTKESEDALLRDLSWLGLDWDEGPGVGGNYGPYRQSERNALYNQYADKLLQTGHVYRCFCSNEEYSDLAASTASAKFIVSLGRLVIFLTFGGLNRIVIQELEKMKETAKMKQLPPVYNGKWASATEMEMQEELAKGTPYTYRFRVPKTGNLKIDDLIRGEVSTYADGNAAYLFCVLTGILYFRAEEHLPNTLRQALIYKALGLPMPRFAHVSLILAPDRSKLSKRHGATSVGQFKEMGFLPQAMVNYLALLGWGDGTENEFFTLDQLVDKFTIERVNKSGAIFDSAKLRWMNGQHLRSLPSEKLTKLIGERWKSTGIVTESSGSFVEEAVQLLKDGIDLITDADKAISSLLSYPLYSTLASYSNSLSKDDHRRPHILSLLHHEDFPEFSNQFSGVMLAQIDARILEGICHPESKPVLEDKLSEVAASLLIAYDRGEFNSALEEGNAGWQKWVKSFGKSLKRKGKSLFMPLRVLLTGKLHGPDMGAGLLLVFKAGKCGEVAPQSGLVTLDERFKILREVEWESFNKDNPTIEPASAVVAVSN
ncbi:hypothetical protein DH2020_047559 [Rehmannia glutinosa]|uniref:glutamate--tRNA ligase n=1 Tax=Rehmannia glutinosa TaxID=99300 RepID=A0ABR0U837_REHGL